VLESDGKTIRSGFWRVSNENSEYKLCDTYPKKLIVPTKISDEELYTIAAFRSGHRIPSLTWGSGSSAASIWRSSQPKTGMSSTCVQDEAMLDQIATARGVRMSPNGLVRNLSEAMLAIIDCRPRTNAYANRAAGAGYELQKNYPNTRLEFYDIPNIHAVRDSFKALSALFQSYNGFVSQGGANVAVAGDVSFGKAVEDTLWLQNIRLILRASWECACIAHKGTPVLVHCSHGWDRTSQVAALAQIFLDPFYR
jgi:myotubularin-related protein 1/2